jgi:hypothetical protein
LGVEGAGNSTSSTGIALFFPSFFPCLRHRITQRRYAGENSISPKVKTRFAPHKSGTSGRVKPKEDARFLEEAHLLRFMWLERFYNAVLVQSFIAPICMAHPPETIIARTQMRCDTISPIHQPKPTKSMESHIHDFFSKSCWRGETIPLLSSVLQ